MSKVTAPGRRARSASSRNPLLRFAAVLALGAAAPLAAAPAAPPVPAAAQAAQPIDEGMFVTINGVEQWITIRGSDVRNPVLLMLHGGPGAAMSNAAPFFAEWEKRYTIVQWDQPGGGATYAKNMAQGTGPITIERYKKDGIAVAEYVRDHLEQRRIALMGFSWGTLLGVEMAQARPDLFSAYIGSAQVVSGSRGTLLGYRMALEAARQRNDATAVKALEQAGPPPYKTLQPYLVRQQYAMGPASLEAPKMAAYMQIATAPPPAGVHYIAPGMPGFDWFAVFMQTWGSIYQEQLAWEAEARGMKFKVPVFIFQGAEDINTPASMAMDWCDRLTAPAKACKTIPGAGHNSMFFRDELLALLDEHVRPVLVKQDN